MECRLLDALPLLSPIVVEQSEGITAQEYDGRQVAGRQEGHEEVDNVPNQFETGHSAEYHHHPCRADAVDGHHRRVGSNEADISLAIIIIADDAGEGEEEDGYGHEHGPDGAHLSLKGRLREGDAVEFWHIVQSADEDDKGGTRTDQQRIGKDTQGLDESLLDGMADGSRSRHVGGTTLACLIREESALNAIHHRSTNAATRNLTDAKGIGHDDFQHMGDQSGIHHDDRDGQQQIADGHEGHQDRTHLSNTLNTTEDDKQRHRCQHAADPERRQSEGLLHGTTDGISLNGIVRQAKLTGNEHRKQDRHPPLMQTTLDIIGRTADERVLVLLLEQLRQRRLYERRSRAHEGYQPHPEHSPRATDGDGRSHTRQIACSHTGSHADGKGLER